MLKTIKKRFALTTKGAKDFCKGVLMTTLLNMALMLPTVFVFLFPDDYLRAVFVPSASVAHGVIYYAVMGASFMLVMYATAIFQYHSTYISIYDEAFGRRTSARFHRPRPAERRSHCPARRSLRIARRMRTVANADKIVVLDSGAPKELFAAKGIFAGMIERQSIKDS